MKKASTSGHSQMLKAIKAVRENIRWKVNSAERHLQKRKLRGHLPETATLEDYEHIILTVLQNESAQVFRYWYNRVPYVTMVATVRSGQWLVMFSYDGVMESAFIVERPKHYLSKPGFEKIGLLSEVENEL
jgi:hypothetical protein